MVVGTGEAFIDVLITLNLAVLFLIAGGRRVDMAIKVTVLQAFLLSGITAVVGWSTGKSEIYLAAFLTLVVKAGVIPYVLHKVEGRVQPGRDTKSYVDIRMSLVFCTALVIVGNVVTGKVMGGSSVFIGTALQTAVAMVLIGLFIMVSRKHVIMQIVGLLVMENGIYLAGVGTASGLPLVVELGIFLDILVGVLIMGVLTFRINRTFDNIDTDNLKNLRG